MTMIDDGCVSLVTQDSNWVIDYGASFHFTSHSDFFTSYRTGDFGNVRGKQWCIQDCGYLRYLLRE